MKNLIVLMSLLLIVSSCSNSSKSKVSNSVRFTVLSENPVFPKIQKLECSGEFISPLEETSIRYLKQGSMSSFNIKQADYKDDDNKIIIPAFYKSIAGFIKDKRVIYNYVEEIEDYTEDLIKDFTDEGRDSEVCPELTTIDDNTVENATLLVTHFIDKTYNAVTENGISLARLKFKIAPSIYTYLLINGGPYGKNQFNRKGYKTDNAYYSPDEQGIVFLPPSKEGKEKGLFGRTPLWEIPMVASHEYGHHIFHTVMTNYENRSDKSIQHLCFNNEINQGFSEKNDALVRKTDIHEAVSSINEGFADLISFYTLSSEESSLKNVTCMEKNRDLNYTSFKNGDRKTFNKHVIGLMNDPISKDTTKNCSDPDFQEIHDLGAVFASIVNETLDLFVTTESDEIQKSEKLKLLLMWLKKFNSEYSVDFKYVDIERGFQRAYELLVQTAIDETAIEVVNICETVEKNFSSMNSNYYFKYLKTCN